MVPATAVVDTIMVNSKHFFIKIPFYSRVHRFFRVYESLTCDMVIIEVGLLQSSRLKDCENNERRQKTNFKIIPFFALFYKDDIAGLSVPLKMIKKSPLT
jgi:hypothetical protein